MFVGHITRMEMMREEVMLGEVRNGEGSGTQEIGKQGQEMSWGRKKEVRGGCGKEQWRREQLRTKSTDKYFWGCCNGILPSVC